jgi:hypothetical protein
MSTGFRTVIIAFLLATLAGAGFAFPFTQTLTFERTAFRFSLEQGYTRVSSRGMPVTAEPGKPELPEKPAYVILPPGTRAIGLRVLETREEAIPGTFRVYPRQMSLPANEKPVWTGPDPIAYSVRQPYPAEIVRLAGQGDFGGVRVAYLLVHPVRVVASEGRLSFVSKVTIELELVSDPRPPLLCRREFAEDRKRREALLRTLTVNPGALGAYPIPEVISGWSSRGGFAPTEEPSPLGSPVRYVIVTSEAMTPAFQVLADYKTGVGMPAVVRTMSWIKARYPRGVDDAETIRNFLRDAYQNWGTTDVLLGGDCNEVPIRYVQWNGYGTNTVPGDHYYACLAGTWDGDRDGVFGEANADSADLFPQLRVGRSPARNPTEAQAFVSKTLGFLEPPDTTYQTDFLLMGASIFQPGDGGVWCDLVSSYAPPELRKIKLYEHNWGQGNLTRDSALYYLNRGPGLIYSQTHGQVDQLGLQRPHKLYREDLSALANGDRTAFWYGVTCWANAVDHDCCGEYAVRNPNGGSAAYYGATRSMYPYPEGLDMDLAFFDSLFTRGHLELGQAVNDSKVPFIASSQVDNPYRLLMLTYLLLGDPDLSVWTARPGTLSLSFPDTVPLGATSFHVGVTSATGPVSGARVTVSKPGEVYASGLTDFHGEVILPIAPQTSGDLQVAVRKGNYLLKRGTASVIAQAPFVTAFRQRLEDDTSGVSSGNGNGVLEAGETAALWLTFKNTGGDVARNLRTTLRTTATDVALLDSVFSIPQALAPGDTYVSIIPMRFRLAAGMPDGRTLTFALETQDSSRVFTQNLVFDGRAPSLAQIGQWVDDDSIPPTHGNGNGIPEPGEVVGLTLRLKNYGGGQDEGVGLTLSSSDTLVMVLDSLARVGRIPGYGEHLTGPSDEVLFEVKGLRSGGGYRLHLRMEDAYGRVADRDFELAPITAPGPLRDTPDSSAITLAWDPLAKTCRYNVYRANQAGGPYTRINADPLSSSGFTDPGLSRGQRFYYVATAMDTSLNESPYSPELEAATFPEYRAGWPREMPTQILATPLVCDLDPAYPGREVIVPTLDNRVFAWHADGTGVLNPDGLFKTVPASAFFVTSPAAGDLDHDGHPEVVETSYVCDTPKVFVWRGDGSDLPGWPRLLEGYPCYASPVLYDLDMDGQLEVIAATMSGRIYVFRHDGTGYIDPSGLFVTVTDSSGVWVGNTPAVGDIDGDSKPEIVVGGGGGSSKLFAFRWDGSSQPNFPVVLGDLFNNSPALGKLDPGHPGLQIVALAQGTQVHALYGDGQELPGWPKSVMVVETRSSTAIGDLDQDGLLEVVVPGDNQVCVFRSDGTPQPGFPVYWPGSAFSSPAIGDLDGDSRMEILAGSSDERLYAWHSDGTKVLGFPVRTWGTYLSSVTLADLGDRRVTTFAASYDHFLYGWQAMTQPGPVSLEWWTFHHDEQRTGQHGFRQPSGAEETRNAGLVSLIPRETALYPNAPNPVVSGSTIRFDLAREGDVRLAVYNIAGERVRTLGQGGKKPGVYRVSWDGCDDRGKRVSSGVYFYRLEAGGFVKTMKMVVTR